MMVDSLEMTDSDREIIKEVCRKSEEEQIVVTHGTDTMAETARVLGRPSLAKTIVLTGAMIPYAFGSSDGLFNLGSALSFVQVLPHGVYVAMNGMVLPLGRRPEEPGPGGLRDDLVSARRPRSRREGHRAGPGLYDPASRCSRRPASDAGGAGSRRGPPGGSRPRVRDGAEPPPLRRPGAARGPRPVPGDASGGRAAGAAGPARPPARPERLRSGPGLRDERRLRPRLLLRRGAAAGLRREVRRSWPRRNAQDARARPGDPGCHARLQDAFSRSGPLHRRMRPNRNTEASRQSAWFRIDRGPAGPGKRMRRFVALPGDPGSDRPCRDPRNGRS